MRNKFLALLIGFVFISSLVVATEAPAVVEKKCVKCHFSTMQKIVTTKKDPSKATDLDGTASNFATDDELKAFLRKEIERDGKKHKTAFKGDDAEMDQLIQWLQSLKKE